MKKFLFMVGMLVFFFGLFVGGVWGEFFDNKV